MTSANAEITKATIMTGQGIESAGARPILPTWT
jgi:DNA-nicking Smr family endonuclease